MIYRLFFVATLCLSIAMTATANSVRFFGGISSNDADRIKIQIDDPTNNLPGPPADIGSTDFTIEFWVNGLIADNPTSAITCGANYQWIDGNIIFDRDRFSQSNQFGISFGNGRVAFGIRGASSNHTICGTSNVLDGQWHHVAVQRQVSNGQLWIHVDGVQEAQGNGEAGDLSYPDNGTISNNCGGPCVNEPYIVLGAEKHDLVQGFNGYIDELRLSTILQYVGSVVTPPSTPFTPDANTAALYHFDEGTGTTINDATPGNQSPGALFFGQGGGAMQGPIWSSNTPFNSTSPGTLQFSASTYNVSEADGTVTITVTRVGGNTSAAFVDYTTSNATAQAGSDYTSTSGRLNWSDGDAVPKSFAVSIINDAQIESSEMIDLTLSGANGASLGSPSTATVTIGDDDTPGAPGTLEFSTSTYSANESDGTATITVTRTGGNSGIASVDYATSDGTAQASSDYTGSSGRLDWADNDALSKTFTIIITDDNQSENSETVNINLSNPSGGTLGSTTTAILTISDNTPSPNNSSGGGGSQDWLFHSAMTLIALFKIYANRRRKPQLQ